MTQEKLPGFEKSKMDLLKEAWSIPLKRKIDMAIDLLQTYENDALRLSDDGYWLAFSGGKDSVVIKELAKMAGVKFHSVYNVTTIDPPELVRFIKEHHQDVEWNRPDVPLLIRLIENPAGPPTRFVRWCCSEYKEAGGRGFGRVIGVRSEESVRRRDMWEYFIADRKSKGFFVCPVLHWTTAQIWAFIKLFNLPYCSLYDEGYKRLGCVGCPFGGAKQIQRDFKRWPRFEHVWRKAIIKYYDNWHGIPTRFGKPRWFEGVANSGEELFEWWKSGKKKEEDSDDCQMSLAFSSGNEVTED